MEKPTYYKNNAVKTSGTAPDPSVKKGSLEVRNLLFLLGLLGVGSISLGYCSSPVSQEQYSATSNPSKQNPDNEKNNYLSEIEIKKIYTDGLNILEERSRKVGAENILSLIEFGKKVMPWKSDTDLSMQNGDSRFIRTVPQNHPDFYRQKPLVATSHGEALNDPIIHIKPYDITDLWAALVFIHELKHAYDLVNAERSPDRAPFESAAYGIEMDAAQVISEGRFFAALDGIIQDYKFSSADEIRNVFYRDRGRFLEMCKKLDVGIGAPPYKSRGERILRHGFCPIALGFRFIELHSKDVLEMNSLKEDFLIKYWTRQRF